VLDTRNTISHATAPVITETVKQWNCECRPLCVTDMDCLSQFLKQCLVKPQNSIFVWQDRFYGENVAEQEANFNKFLQKFLYFRCNVLWCILYVNIFTMYFTQHCFRKWTGSIPPAFDAYGHTCTLTWISQIRAGYTLQRPYLHIMAFYTQGPLIFQVRAFYSPFYVATFPLWVLQSKHQ